MLSRGRSTSSLSRQNGRFKSCRLFFCADCDDLKIYNAIGCPRIYERLRKLSLQLFATSLMADKEFNQIK